jgi:hypothetical protein
VHITTVQFDVSTYAAGFDLTTFVRLVLRVFTEHVQDGLQRTANWNSNRVSQLDE